MRGRYTTGRKTALHIVSIIGKAKGYTLDEVIQNLMRVGIDVSKKTVERDIDYITANFFVYEEERDGKIVYLAKKFSLEHISFSISELVSLYFTHEVMQSYAGLDIGKTAVAMLDKIIATAPQINRSYIDTLKDMIKVSAPLVYPEKDIQPGYLESLREAISQRKSLFMSYHAFNSDQILERKFDPYLLEICEGCWHVVGFCQLRQAVRDFRVSRIICLETLDECFNRPDNFYEDYTKQRFDRLSGSNMEMLRVRFQGDSARYVQEYESSKADCIIEDGQGSIIFERTSAMTPDILKWVLGFGAEAEVLEPDSLLQDVKKQIEQLYKNYSIKTSE